MKTVLFFARDPGGANVVLPVYEQMKEKFNTVLYAKDIALKRFREANYPVEDIEMCGVKTYEDVLAFLKDANPDVVITGTSLDDFTERHLWKAAENLHIKTFAILDQWMNLGIRFSVYDYSRAEEYHNHREHVYLPYRVLVMDELAEEWLRKDGISKERIVLTGQPHFDTVRERFQHAGEVYDRKYWNVVFVSEPVAQAYDSCTRSEPYWGYNERTIFDSLYHGLEKLAETNMRKIRLVIRPHPREDLESWKETIEKLEKDNIKLEIDAVNDSFSVIKSADLICGMSSMFLLEALICRKPVLSIQIGLQRINPFVLDRIGQCKSILSERELEERLEKIFLQEDGKNSENTKGGVCENAVGYPKGVYNATEQIVRLVEEEMEK